MKLAFVDYRITVEEHRNLSKYVDKIIFTPKNVNLYPAIDGHPDIQLTLINQENISLVVAKNIDSQFLTDIKDLDIKYIFSNNDLKQTYPFDIPLNCLFLKDYLIHNLSYSDKTILELAKNKRKINVKQGYTKCSTVVVNEQAFITSDKSIYNNLLPYGFDILLIDPGNILLPGLNYGFIGGCSGLIDDSKIAFFGSLNYHPQGEEIKNFLIKYNIEPIYLYNGPLIDRGSILFSII